MNVYADNKGRAYTRTPTGPVRVGTVQRTGARWRFLDPESRTNGARYYTRGEALRALAEWMEETR